MQQLMTVGDVAGWLHVRPGRVYELVAAGAIPAVRLGRTIRFDPEVVRAWLGAGGTPPEVMEQVRRSALEKALG